MCTDYKSAAKTVFTLYSQCIVLSQKNISPKVKVLGKDSVQRLLLSR